MTHDHEYLRTLYNNNTLENFLKLVVEEDIDDPYTRAIVSTLKRSIRTLHLQYNPIVFSNTQKKSQELNHPHNP